MPRSEQPPAKLLLVEGKDDEHVVEHLRRKLAPDLTFSYRDAGGSDPLLKSIPLELRPDDRVALGILMDANADAAARWQAIGDRLRKEKVRLPDRPAGGGTIIEGDLRVGVWLMPNNATPASWRTSWLSLCPRTIPFGRLPSSMSTAFPAAIDAFRRVKRCGRKSTLGLPLGKSR